MNTLTYLLQSTLLFMVANSGKMGPFEIVIISAENCPAGFTDEKLVSLDVRTNRLSRNKLTLNVNMSTHIILDDKIDATVNIAKQTNQGWKDNFFILNIKKAISSLKMYLPAIERDLARQLKTKGFPVPPGNYSLSVPLNIDVKTVPGFPYGLYRTRVYLLRGNSRIVCVQATTDIVPKKNG